MAKNKPSTSTVGLHAREADFHDDWAASVDPSSLDVRAAFESLTAVENSFIVRKMKEFGGGTGCRLLDIGAGLGESSTYFALLGYDATCTDLSPGMVNFAIKLAQINGVSIGGVVCPAEKLNVDDASFDFVYAANVLHHVEDRDAMVSEIDRVLRPGGWFFTWDPLIYNPVINVYRKMASGVRTEDEEPLRFSEVARMEKTFQKVRHREFWISTLSIFLKYYLIDRVHPNADRYWKRIYRETPESLWWWRPLLMADNVATRIPLVRRLAWNTVMYGQKVGLADRRVI